MGIFNDLFGGLFDLDGDGKTSFLEEVVAYQTFRKAEEEEQKARDEEDELNELLSDYELSNSCYQNDKTSEFDGDFDDDRDYTDDDYDVDDDDDDDDDVDDDEI